MKWDDAEWKTRLRAGEWAAAEDRDRLRRLCMHHTIWLASLSPRREAILNQCRVSHRVVAPSLDEPPPRGPDWRYWVRAWALKKAMSVQVWTRPGTIVAADTIVVFRSKGLGKPRDQRDAANMLRALSGRVHQVYTGVAVCSIRRSLVATGSVVSHVHFRRLSEAEIARYVKSGEPLDKAGAYAIQGAGGHLVDRISGPLDNIIGLPVACLTKVMARVLT